MTSNVYVRPRVRGSVIGLGLGRSAFVGRGVGLLIACALPALALGAPQGAQVAAGKATFRQNGNTTVIRASNGAIIDYTGFNIGRNETVRFVQPNSSSRVLNRVSGEASVIDGTLRANGIVYIANPAGIYFAKGSFVDVGQIYAAAGTITNADFLAQRDRFQGVRGEVINEGSIHANVAALVGDRVVNAGAIEADRGVIAMVSGNEVTLQRRGDTMSVKVSKDALTSARPGAAPGVENSGTIDARRGSALMAAGDMVSLAVRNTGSVKARDVRIEGHGTGTVEVSGAIDAANQAFGQRGGSVTITGERVDLAGATINASGNQGGGTIRVGGDVHGAGDLRTATATTVDRASSIRADAVDAGNGGTIVVWSDTRTTFAGSASASGGAAGGDGGFIETSGKQTIDFGGSSVLARAGEGGGKAGSWLIDPGTVTIDAAAAMTIENALEASMSITLDTAIDGVAGPEDINFTAPIATTAGAGGTLTLNAGNDINASQSITAAGAGVNFNLVFNAGNDVNLTANVATNGGTFLSTGNNFTSGPGGAVTTSGGALTLNHSGLATIGANLNSSGGGNAGAISVTAGDVVVGGALTSGSLSSISLLPASGVAQVRINNGAGDFNLSSAELASLVPGTQGVIIGNSSTPMGIGSDGPFAVSSNLTLNGSSITFNDAVTLLGASRTLTLNAASVVDAHAGTDANVAGAGGTLAMNVSASGALGTNVVNFNSNSAGAIVSIQEADGIALGTVSAGTLTVDAVGAITDSGTLTVGAGGATFRTFVDLGAPITLNSPASTFAGPVALRTLTANGLAPANGAIVFTSNASLDLGGVQTLSSATITLTGNLTDSGTLSIGGPATFTTFGTGNIDLSELSLGASPLSLNTSGAVGAGDATVVNAGAFTLGASSIKGSLNATATGALLTVGGVVGVGGGATLRGADVAVNSALTAGATGIALSPDTVGAIVAVHDSINPMATFIVSTADLANLNTTGSVTIGRSDGSGEINIAGDGAIDLSAGGLNKNYDLTLLGGPLNINGALTLFNGKTFTARTQGIGGAHAGTDITIAGAGNVVVDSTAQVTLDTAVAQLAAKTTGGSITVSNTGPDLTIVTLGGVAGVSAGGGAAINLTSTGSLTINNPVSTTGIATLLADGDIDITTPAAGISAATLNITSTNGMISNGAGSQGKTAVSSMLTASGKTGVALDNTGTITAVVTSTMGPITFLNSGALTIAGGTAFTSGGNDIALGVGDLVLGGGGFNIDAGIGTVTIGSSGSAGTIDIGDVSMSSAEVKVSNTELAAIKAMTLTIGDGATKALGVKSTIASAWTDIGALELRASENTGKITFTDDGATANLFKNLDARANNGISVSGKGIDVNGGNLLLDGDEDALAAPSMAMDSLMLANGVTIQTIAPGGGDVTLRAATGGIVGAGSFTIASQGNITLEAGGSGQTITMNGNDGVTVNGNLTSSMGPVQINADFDADGMGTFTLAAAKTINTTNQSLSIFGADVDLGAGSSIDTGSAGAVIARTTAGGITLGNVGGAPAGDLKLSNAELLAFKGATLQVGSNLTTLMTVDGVDLSPDPMGMPPGAPTLTGALTLVADDLTIAGAGINTRTTGLSITRGNTGTVGIGAASGDMTISNAELDLITAAQILTVGGGGISDITVDGVLAANVDTITGIFTLGAGGDLTFSGGGSVFQSLTGTAGDALVINTDVATNAGDLNLTGGTGGVSITAGRTLQSAEDLSLSSTAGVITGAGALTLNAAKNVTVGRPMTTAGVTVIRADMDTNGSGVISLADLDTTNNTLTLTGAGATFNGNIRTGTASAVISRSTAGTIQIGDFTKVIGDSPAEFTLTGADLQRLITTNPTIGGATTTALNVRNVTAAQSLNIAGTTTLLAQGAGGDITFDGTTGSTFVALDATAADALNVNGPLKTTFGMDLMGATITSSSAGEIESGGVLNMNAATTIATDADITAGGALNLTAGTSITTGAMVVSTGGNIVFDAGAGAGHFIRLRDNVDTTEFRSVTFKSPVVLSNKPTKTNPLTIQGHAITFESTVDSDTTQARRLTIVTERDGTVTFQGAVGSNNPLQQLKTVDSIVAADSGTAILNGDVTTTQLTQFLTKVMLTNSVTVESTDNSVVFGGSIDGDAAGTRDLTVLVDRAVPASPTGRISTMYFAGPVGGTNALRSLFLNYTGAIDGRATPPSVATIISRPIDANGNVPADPGSSFASLFYVTDTFRMGRNEKLTSLGDLSINAGTAVIGDINALRNLTVDASSITIQRRPTGPLLTSTDNPDAAVNEEGVDYVAGGEINFTSTPTLTGTGADPEFGTSDGQRGPSAGTLGAFLFRAVGELNSSSFNFAPDFEDGSGALPDARTLDLPASGPSSTDPSTTRARAIPRETRQNQVGQDTTISQANKEVLINEFSIFARDPFGTELLQLLTGGALYDDLPKRGLRTTAQDFTTVTTRLPSEAVGELVAAYRATFSEPELDEAGNPVIDPETGKAKYTSRTQAIKEAIDKSLQRFTRGKSGEIDPRAFRSYVDSTPEEAQTKVYLDQIAAFIARLDNIGLTPRELRQARTKILNSVRPKRITSPAVFESIIRAEAVALRM